MAAAAPLQEAVEARGRPAVGLSLRGRALRFLARREHSRTELRSKLLAHASDGATLDALLDDLEAIRLLSDRRYAEVVAQSRGPRYGVASVAHTLAKRGVASELAAETLAPLRATEKERALEICRRRFGEPADDLKGRLKQHRFLLRRGFDPATVSSVLKHWYREVRTP